MLTHSLERPVRWSECDKAGILYGPLIYTWFDEALESLFRSIGHDWRETFGKSGHLGMPLLESGCRFLSPMAHGETVRVTASIKEVGRSSVRVEYEVKKGETLSVTGYEIRVLVGQEAAGAIRSSPIPDAIRQKLIG